MSTAQLGRPTSPIPSVSKPQGELHGLQAPLAHLTEENEVRISQSSFSVESHRIHLQGTSLSDTGKGSGLRGEGGWRLATSGSEAGPGELGPQGASKQPLVAPPQHGRQDTIQQSRNSGLRASRTGGHSLGDQASGGRVALSHQFTHMGGLAPPPGPTSTSSSRRGWGGNSGPHTGLPTPLS